MRVGLSVLAVVLSAVLPAAARASSGGGHVAVSQRLAVLLSNHKVHRSPGSHSAQVALVGSQRPITGEQTTLPVIGHTTDGRGIRWLRVMLPGRPNGSSGWIAAQGTRPLLTHWHIVVSLGSRQVRVFRSGHLLRSFSAVVGKPSTPTPTGDFFVEETEQMPAGHPGGPYALALSARSNALQEFEGGPGQIALHGRDGLAGEPGTAASHGCVRLSTAAIEWLASRIGPGTPVTIHG